MPGEVILTIKNRHIPGCGVPPTLEQTPSVWLSYFENEHGEQWLFRYDRSTQAWQVWGGDLGWNCLLDTSGRLSDVVLGFAEQLWLQSCLVACDLPEVSAALLTAWSAWRDKLAQLGLNR